MSIPRNEQEIQVFNAINSRAASDGEYRSRLLKTPHAALAEIGITVPESYRVKFIERDADADAVVVLPDLLAADGELSAEQLEAVAGGGLWAWIVEHFTVEAKAEVCVSAST
jgi:hypothetical protein